jgi:hypothetical protein
MFEIQKFTLDLIENFFRVFTDIIMGNFSTCMKTDEAEVVLRERLLSSVLSVKSEGGSDDESVIEQQEFLFYLITEC